MVEIEFLPIGGIAESHLRNLVENKVAESLTLEFKGQAVGTNDGEKREFLKDVTALANTAGGMLIYGIGEKEGAADDVAALAVTSMDKEILRLQSILKDAVEPSIIGVEMGDVPLSAGGCALVVKVPRSWRPPHRVTHGNVNRFYRRHSKGVFELDTEGLRQVFNGGLDQERQLEAWRDERLERLKTGARGFRVAGTGSALIQVASLARGQPRFQIPSVQNVNLDFMPPMGGNSTHRWNFDGLLLHSPQEKDDTVRAYTQIFSSWKIETAFGGLVQPIDERVVLRFGLLVPGIFAAASQSIKGMIKHGAFGPFAVAVTITGLAGSSMQEDYYRAQIDRDVLRFPILIIGGDVSGIELQKELLPIWDGLWQAYGHERCQHVRDGEGNWKGIPSSWR